MKRTIFTLLLVMGLSTISVSSQNSNVRRGDRRQVSTEMRLTDEQREKMRQVEKDFKEKADKINASKLTADERKDQMSKLRDEKMEAKKKVWTKEQQEFFAKRNLRNDGSRPFAGNRNWNKDSRRGRNLGGDCCLDNNYSRKSRPGALNGNCCVGATGQAMGGGCPYLGNDLNLTEEQKQKLQKLWGENQKDREQMQEKHRTEMKKILTPEQLEKVEKRK